MFYLCYWMWQSGLADLLPTLRREAVYVGLSGGSMVVTPPHRSLRRPSIDGEPQRQNAGTG